MDIYEELNVSEAEWYILKDAVLGTQFSDEWVKKIPAHLKDHPVTLLLKKYMKTKKNRYLNEAAKLLAGGIAKPWLYLEKS